MTPCPFCHAHPILHTPMPRLPGYRVECRCGVCGPWADDPAEIGHREAANQAVVRWEILVEAIDGRVSV